VSITFDLYIEDLVEEKNGLRLISSKKVVRISLDLTNYRYPKAQQMIVNLQIP